MQIKGEVIHVVVKRCYNMTGLLRQLTEVEQDPHLKLLSRADEDGELYDRKNTRVQKHKVVQGDFK